MNVSTIAPTPRAAAPAPVTVQDLSGWPIGEVKRGVFARNVSIIAGEHKSSFASLDDAITAAKLVSAGPAPAAVVFEHRYMSDGSPGVPADQQFGLYGVDFQEWKASRGGTLINSGEYSHGTFSRTKGYDIDNDDYSDGTRHETVVLVDGDLTWSNATAT